MLDGDNVSKLPQIGEKFKEFHDRARKCFTDLSSPSTATNFWKHSKAKR